MTFYMNNLSRILFFFLTTILVSPVYAQYNNVNGITFHVEDLEYIAQNLYPMSADKILRNMLTTYASSAQYESTRIKGKGPILIPEKTAPVEYEILKASIDGDSLCFYGFNPFYKGLMNAFAYHRAVVLSPDMIWLLISQAFGHYVNNNVELLRHQLVNHDKNKTLTVVSKYNLVNESGQVEWAMLLNDFEKQITANSKKDISDMLTADFSTTGSVEKIASQITLMETVKSFFEYKVMSFVCGIPDITLLGTPEDWRKIREKASRFSEFGLEWWIKELDPILVQFVNASEGNIDIDFWQGMVKKKRPGEVRFTSCIPNDNNLTQFDGWFLKFYPFDMNGRTPEKISYNHEMLPEVVRVPFKYVLSDLNGNVLNEYEMEFWSGFFGIKENPENGSLIPKIGWLICKVQ